MANLVAWPFTDPGCPWGYSSRPAVARLRWRFGDQIRPGAPVAPPLATTASAAAA